MARILAIADQPSSYLTQRLDIHSPIDYLLSCGDLHHSYLNSLASQSNQLLYYINGNHDYITPTDKRQFGFDLHDRLIETDDFLICGFSGVKKYKNDLYQFTETQMNQFVSNMLFRLWLYKIKLKFSKNINPKPLIVLSHTPPFGVNDRTADTRQGFRCYLKFIEKANPFLWLHGHIHLHAFNEIEKSCIKQTTVVNVYEFKYIVIDDNKIDIGYRF